MSSSRRFLYWLVAGMLVLNGLVGFSAYLGLNQFKERDIRRAELETQNLAQAIDQGVSRSIEKIDASLVTVANELERQLATGRFNQAGITRLIGEQRALHVHTDTWSATDKDGTLIFSEGNRNPKKIMAADRDYFKVLKTGKQAGLVMSLPIQSKISGKHVIAFVRAYRYPDGRFAGTVIAPVSLEYFLRMISGFNLGEHSVVTLRTQNLELIARQPAPPDKMLGEPGTIRNVSNEFRKLAQTHIQQATYTATTPEDQIKRIYTFHRLNIAPIFVVAGVGEQDYLTDWYRIRRFTLAYWAIFMGMSILAARTLYRFWLRQCQDATDLQKTNQQLNTTLQALHTQDVSMRAALEIGELGICSLDLISGEWTSSPEQDGIFGISGAYPRTLDSWTRLIHPADRGAVIHHLNTLSHTRERSFNHEYRIIRPADGALRWIHCVGRLDYQEDGSPSRFFGAIKDITELRESQQRIKHLAYHDDLTGLPNRVLLAERMQQALTEALQRQDLLAICFLDLDGFKPINDEWGHDIGDQVLIEVARRLVASTRADDTIARMGGDEFVVLLSHLNQEEELEETLKRMLGIIATPFQVAQAKVSLTMSVGVTLFPHDKEEDADTLIRHADHAMYEAKHRGKNCIHMFDPASDRRLRETLAKYARIIVALEHHEFRLHYQPKVDMHSDTVIGVEALIRWHHPQEGLLGPGSFLPVVENTELTLEMGEWVIREALGQKRAWQHLGLDLPVSVNVFALHLQRADFVTRLAAILAEFPEISPGGLELEILETSILEDLDEVSRCIRACAALGVGFALDDFGTGYSSLSYFRRFPVQTLKIDQSFVRDILSDPEDLALVTSIISMAHGLQRQVVAEGVESIEHGLPLLRAGCDYAQGFGIARPMPAEAIPDWIHTWRRPTSWIEMTHHPLKAGDQD